MTAAMLAPRAIIMRVLMPLAGAFFLSAVYRNIMAVVGPPMAEELGLDAAALGLMASALFGALGFVQVPLGLALDRFGPRRVQVVLLSVGAVACLWFARSNGLPEMIGARVLMGIGICACLMAGFTANAQWWPKQRIPVMNGWFMAMGSSGGLAATLPAQWAVGIVGWRGLFDIIGVVTIASAIWIALVLPDHPSAGSRRSSIAEQLRDVARIWTAPFFWRVAPAGALSSAIMHAWLALWVGGWLRDVANMPPTAAATILLMANGAQMVGLVVVGSFASRLQARGKSALVAIGAFAGTLAMLQLVIAATHGTWPWVWWVVFGFFATSSSASYGVLTQHFPPALAGRATTALNLLVLTSSFAMQWGVGIVIDLWPRPPGGGYAPEGYRVALICQGVVHLLSIVWLLWPRRERPAN